MHTRGNNIKRITLEDTILNIISKNQTAAIIKVVNDYNNI